MDTNLLTYLACICFIFIFGRIFILPLKKILKLIFNSILGGACIYIINLIGATFDFHIGLNFFTSIIIRFVRFARGCLLGYHKVANWIIMYCITHKIAKECEWEKLENKKIYIKLIFLRKCDIINS